MFMNEKPLHKGVNDPTILSFESQASLFISSLIASLYTPTYTLESTMSHSRPPFLQLCGIGSNLRHRI
jgi:hypothetical protein